LPVIVAQAVNGHTISDKQKEANARLIAAAPDLLRKLDDLATKAKQINDLQHAGVKIDDDLWSELYAIQNEAFGVIAKTKGDA
jgi:hypothetical protein